MATASLTTTATTLDAGTAAHVWVTNTGSTRVTVLNGSERRTIRPGRDINIIPTGAVTALVTVQDGSTGSVRYDALGAIGDQVIQDAVNRAISKAVADAEATDTGTYGQLWATPAASTTLTGTLAAWTVTAVDCTAGAGARSLPAASSVVAGVAFVAKKGDTSANALVVSRAGSDLIYGTGAGSTTKTLTLSGEAVEFVSNGVDRWTVRASDTPSAALAALYAGRFSPTAFTSLAVASTDTVVDGFRDVVSWRGTTYLAGAWNNGGVTLGGKLYTVDLATGALTMVYDTGQQTIATILPFGDKLYLGTGIGGRVYSWDGTTGALAFTGTVGRTIQCSAVVGGIAYFGETGSGKTYSFDGTTWATAFTMPSPQVTTYSMRRWQGMLLVGGATSADAAAWQVFLWDGTNLGPVAGLSGVSNTHSEALSLETWRESVYVGEYSSGGNANLTRWNTSTGSVTRIAVTGQTALYGLRTYRDAIYVLSHPNGILYRYDGTALTAVGTASGGGSLRRAAVVDDRLLVTRMLIGTGGAASLYVYGDGAVRPTPAQDQELRSAVEVATSSTIPDPWVGTFDPRIPMSSFSITANRAYAQRVRIKRMTYVSALKIGVAIQSGNIDVGIYQAATGFGPHTWIASSGSTACPAASANPQSISLTAGVWLSPGDYQFNIAADNSTANFYGHSPSFTLGSLMNQYADTSFPLPTSTFTGTASNGRCYGIFV